MELEIKVMWCKGLTAFNFFQKLSIYAAVFITSEDERIQLTDDQKQEQKTPVDENGDGNPEWNYPMKFDLQSLNFIDPDYRNLGLVFELRNQGQLLFGDKVIGEVRVRLKDLIQSVGNEVVRFVSYEVRNPEGKHNGILDFSYKVISDVNTSVSLLNQDVQISGYHHHHHHHHEFDGSHEQQNQQSNESYAESTNSSEIHMIGYHHHHSNNHFDESVLFSESEKIEYPKIDLEGYNNLVVSAPPSVYPPSLSSSSSSLVYPPPPPQTWAPAPYPPPSHYPLPSHYPPPQPNVYPPPQPNVYPSPPPPEQRPYGDPHWGYHRPPGYHPHW